MPIHDRRLRVIVGAALTVTAVFALTQAASAAVTGTNVASTVANAIGTNTGSGFTFTVGPTQAATGNNVPSLSGFPTPASAPVKAGWSGSAGPEGPERFRC